MQDIHYKKGSPIFAEGDRSSAAYLIVEGEVEIRKGGQTDDVSLAVLKSGEVFGEMGLVEERPRSASAKARTDVTLSKVAYHEFVDMLVNRPRDSMKYIRRLMERLRLMSARLAHLESVESSEAPENETTLGSFRVKVVPDSREALKAVSAEGVDVKTFPFRLGRASRHASEDPLQANHLMLLDSAPYSVSRNHCAINLVPEGVSIEERGSFLGTIVNGSLVGGERTVSKKMLNPGENEVILGTRKSPFRFKVLVYHDL